MAGVNVKMGVSGVSAFKKGINESKQAVKTFDEALKLNEAQLKATGDAETYLENKSKLLGQQMKAQQQVVKQAEAALEQMKRNGVSASSTEFQRMQQQVMQARTKLMEIKGSMEGAGSSAKDLGDKISGIGKGVAWDNVAEGIGKITNQLANGARAAVNFGKKLIASAKGSTGLADEIKTTVDQYEDMGLTADSYQRMVKVAEFIDTPVDAILTARSRMAKALTTDKGVKNMEEVLGITLNGQSSVDLFWETGEALMNMGESFDKEAAAQNLFGRSWRELRPLFKAGRDEYEKMLAEQNVLTDEQVEKLGKADDAIKSMEQEIETLKAKFWAENADTITSLLEWMVDNKDAVVTALGAIGVAFGGMKIVEMGANIGKVVDGIKTLMNIGGGGGAGGGVGGVATGVGGAIKTALAAGLKAAAPALGVTALALTPAILAQNATWAESESQRQARIGAVGTSQSANAEFVRKAAEAVTIRNGANADFGAMEALLMGLSSRKNQQKAELYNVLQNAAPTAGSNTWGLLNRLWGGEAMDSATIHEMLENITDAFAAAENKVQVPVEPAVEDGAAEAISQEIGAVPVTVIPQIAGFGSHANGLPYVPFDGYMAMLHRGERIVPAREVNSSRNFSSNLYVESMYMNNGQDADGLAAAIAAENRRMMSGYGS